MSNSQVAMRAWRLSRRGLLLGLAASGVSPRRLHAAEGIAASPPGGIGMVEDVRGEARAARDGRMVQLAPGMPILVGELLATGNDARLVLTLGAATRLRLGERTKLRVDAFEADRTCEFALGGGAVLYDHAGRSAKSDIEFNTLYGRLKVRGTRFFAGPVDGGFGVFVLQGAVSVFAGGVTVNLEPGDGTVIPEPGAAPAGGRGWSEGRIRGALALVE